MTQVAVTVGIDCGKAWLDGAVFPGAERICTPNTSEGRTELVAWARARGATVVGLEASGGYERAVRDVCDEAGLAVHVLDPARVRHFARAKGQRAKTDPLDAALIAEFTARFVDTPPKPRDPVRENLAGLLRARRALVAKRADLRHVVAHVPDSAKDKLGTALAAMDQAIAALDSELERCVDAAPALAQTAARLRTAPGLGPVTAITLVARLPELGQLRGAPIAALIGVAPYPDDSGQRVGQRHIAGGRADVRHGLYMATMVAATRGSGVIAAFYKRLIAAGKQPKVALTACMRKMVVRLNAMLAHNTDWSEEPA